MTPVSPRSGGRRFAGISSVAALMCAAVALAAEPMRVRFAISAGPADETLRAFTAQTDCDLLFSTEAVRSERTNAVHGDYTAEEALARLIVGTALRVVRDQTSSVLRVVRVRDRSRATPPREVSVRDPNRGTRDAGTQERVDDIVVLSPFAVTTEQNMGYLATGTLAGSRLNRSLRDTPASISVMTRQFLDDVGATNIYEALSYALNAERDTSDATGNPWGAGDIPLAIRGFSGASVARNFFQWGLESDTYNTERLDFSRGPNSILFGVGGPGGIINTTTKRATFGRDHGSMALRLGSWQDYRATFDLNRELTRTLVVRLNGMRHAVKSWREFVQSDRVGGALAATWRPFPGTEVRFDGEYGEFDRVYSNPYLPFDAVTPWIAAGRPIARGFDPNLPAVGGTTRNNSQAYVHDPITGTMFSWYGGVNPVSTSRALTDFSVLPLKATLSGDGNVSDSRFHNVGLFVEQSIGPVWIEAAFNRQAADRTWVTSLDWANVMLKADANATLPDGRPNPNAGRFYVEGNAQKQEIRFVTDDVRLTATYTLDLHDANPWLGSLTFTGLISRRLDDRIADNLYEVNTTPAGDSAHPLALDHTSNRLWRRIYVDPFGAGRRGDVDAREHQAPLNGVTPGFARVVNQGTVSRQDLRSRLFGGQARLLRDRLVITAGLRHDLQRTFGGTAVKDPVTGTWPRQTLTATSIDYKGDTRTIGAVWHVTSWGSLFYNRSDNFTGQSTLTILGTQLGPKRGEGEDFGAKLRLFDDRLYATATHYETSEFNRLVFAYGEMMNAINEIYQALGEPDRVAGPTSRDSIDTIGEGWEFELTAQPTTGWQVTANFSVTHGTQTNNQPRNRGYIAARRGAWAAQGGLPLIAPIDSVPSIDPATGAPATISTALDYLDGLIELVLSANGVTQRQLREYTGSLFTAYTFAADRPWIGGLTAGAGLRYRSAPVIGYEEDGLEPLLGNDEIYVNLLLRKSVRILERDVEFRLNLDNLFDVDDPILVDGSGGVKNRFLYPERFRGTLSATMHF